MLSGIPVEYPISPTSFSSKISVEPSHMASLFLYVCHLFCSQRERSSFATLSTVSMNVPRRSTVYDLASLRLHTDGSRVYQSSSTNLKPRNAKLALRDIRGNWIARDAGGTAKIPRWKNVSTPATEDGSVELEELSQSNLVEPELEEQEKQGDKEDEEGDEQNTLKRKPKRIDRRTAKRRKFAHDQSYLGETAADANFTEESRFLPLPSSVSSNLLCQYPCN